MGHNEGQALAYGHIKEADGIEGLELLDQHFAALRKEANGGISDGSDAEYPEDQDDEAGWDNWDRNEDGDESDSSGWEEVIDNEDDLEISDSDDDEPKPARSKLSRKAEEMADEGPKAKKAKTTKSAATEAEDEDEADDADKEEDVDMDDDTKSVVSAAPSAATDSTKKLSLLAQQKVCFNLTPHLVHLAYISDLDTCRLCSPQRAPSQSSSRISRHHFFDLC